jgi:hypothetical protein
VTELLKYFRLARNVFPPRELLLELGRQVASILVQDEFSHTTGEGPRRLTNAGYALAADMGLLTAELLQDKCAGGSLEWKVMRRPKSDASFNFPVLVGRGKLTLDPIRVSCSEAAGILEGERRGDAWAKILDYVVSVVESTGR